jgi:hypothetical protein
MPRPEQVPQHLSAADTDKRRDPIVVDQTQRYPSPGDIVVHIVHNPSSETPAAIGHA